MLSLKAHLFSTNTFQTHLALLYDGIKLLARAISELNVALNIQPISCGDAEPWPHGSSLINYMRRVGTNHSSKRFSFHLILDYLGLLLRDVWFS